jgi:hypothetical protein
MLPERINRQSLFKKAICFLQVFVTRQYLKIPRNMQSTACFTTKRVLVVNMMDDACFLRQPAGFCIYRIDLQPMLSSQPLWDSQSKRGYSSFDIRQKLSRILVNPLPMRRILIFTCFALTVNDPTPCAMTSTAYRMAVGDVVMNALGRIPAVTRE